MGDIPEDDCAQMTFPRRGLIKGKLNLARTHFRVYPGKRFCCSMSSTAFITARTLEDTFKPNTDDLGAKKATFISVAVKVDPAHRQQTKMARIIPRFKVIAAIL